jgi:hypothetical protein
MSAECGGACLYSQLQVLRLAAPGKNVREDLYKIVAKRAGVVAQAMEHLPSNHEALSSNSSTTHTHTHTQKKARDVSTHPSFIHSTNIPHVPVMWQEMSSLPGICH